MKNFKKHITSLNLVFFVEVLIVSLVIFNVIPREAVLFLAGLLIYFVLFAPKEDSVLLIARSIPVFVALPITENFDSLNTWRILVLILFLKWFFDSKFFLFLDALFKIIKKAKESFLESIKFAYKNWTVEFLTFLIFFISLLSLFKAEDVVQGVKRIIYFVNLSMLFFVVRSLAQKIGLVKIAKNVLISVALVVFVGFLQLFWAYFTPINDFSEFWAYEVNETLYGKEWANIAIRANTWFAYYNEAIKLRMFSSFPDTHSFPLYLLMGSVFLMVILKKYISEKNRKKYIFYTVFLAFLIFATILSGTRGIWASFIIPVFILFFWKFRKIVNKETLKLTSIPLFLFLILLPLSAPIFSSNQFKIDTKQEVDSNIFAERLKSIVDTNEVSNKGRVYIWKESIRSISEQPLLGVGINNFPVVLKENLTASKAGASAHNIYLNVASEIGIFGLFVFLLMIYQIIKQAWILFLQNKENIYGIFALALILIISWIAGYTMTDVAITDERAFLMLMILLGVLFSFSKQKEYAK